MVKLTQGQRLRLLVKNSNWSIAEFANQMGVARETLSRYFKRAELDPDVITAAAGILQLPEVHITGEDIEHHDIGNPSPGEAELLRRIQELENELKDLKAENYDLMRMRGAKSDKANGGTFSAGY
jgi:transcriptional regulator with XRE-family HTH domain